MLSFSWSFSPGGLSAWFLLLPSGTQPQRAFGGSWGETSLVNSLFKLDIFLAPEFPLSHKVILTVPTDVQLTNCPGFYASWLCCVIILWEWFVLRRLWKPPCSNWAASRWATMLKMTLTLSGQHRIVAERLGAAAWQPDFQFLLSKVQKDPHLLAVIPSSFLLCKVEGTTRNEGSRALSTVSGTKEEPNLH